MLDMRGECPILHHSNTPYTTMHSGAGLGWAAPWILFLMY